MKLQILQICCHRNIFQPKYCRQFAQVADKPIMHPPPPPGYDFHVIRSFILCSSLITALIWSYTREPQEENNFMIDNSDEN